MANETKGKKARKTPDMDKETFLAKAEPLVLTAVNKQGQIVTSFTLTPREFSSGSWGYGLHGEKRKLGIDGKQVEVQIGMNLILTGSAPNKGE